MPNPIDSLDECYYKHDKCYGKAENKCQCKPRDCIEDERNICDNDLLDCMNNLPVDPKDWAIAPTNSTKCHEADFARYHSYAAISAQAFARTYYRNYKDDPY